jgi:hypothetical protein
MHAANGAGERADTIDADGMGSSARLAVDTLLPARVRVIAAYSETPLPGRARAPSCAVANARRTGVVVVRVSEVGVEALSVSRALVDMRSADAMPEAPGEVHSDAAKPAAWEARRHGDACADRPRVSGMRFWR